MTEIMIRNAYCKIRKIDQTIPDEVLDFMKDAAIEKIRTQEDICGYCGHTKDLHSVHSSLCPDRMNHFKPSNQ